jgi:hypothetical protein
MSIVVYCDECGQNAQVRDEMAGRSIRCRACGSSISVPDVNDDDGGQDDYRVQPQRRSSRPRSVRDESDGGGFSLAAKIISVCVAIGVGTIFVLARIMIRAGLRGALRGDQEAAAPAQQPNQFPRPNVNAPPQHAAPANFPPAPTFPRPNMPPTVPPMLPPPTPPALPPTVPPPFPPGFPPAGHGAPGMRPPIPPRLPPGPRGMRRATPTALRQPARTGTTTAMYGGSGGSPFQVVVPEGPLLGLRCVR